RADGDELGEGVEVEAVGLAEGREGLLGDGDEGDLGDVERAFVEEGEQQVEGALEDGGAGDEGGVVCVGHFDCSVGCLRHRCRRWFDKLTTNGILCARHGYATACVTGGGVGASGRPRACASAAMSFIISWKLAGVSDCAPSESAWSGLGCTSV